MTKRITQKMIGGTMMCFKVKYDTEREAKKQVKRARKTGVVRHYYCHHCDCWHLTSQRKKRKVDKVASE